MCFGGRLIFLLTGVCVIFQMKTTPCVTGLVKFCHSCRRGRYTCVNSGFLSNIDTKIRDSSLPTTPYDVTEVTHQHLCHFCDLKEGQRKARGTVHHCKCCAAFIQVTKLTQMSKTKLPVGCVGEYPLWRHHLFTFWSLAWAQNRQIYAPFLG